MQTEQIDTLKPVVGAIRAAGSAPRAPRLKGLIGKQVVVMRPPESGGEVKGVIDARGVHVTVDCVDVKLYEYPFQVSGGVGYVPQEGTCILDVSEEEPEWVENVIGGAAKVKFTVDGVDSVENGTVVVCVRDMRHVWELRNTMPKTFSRIRDVSFLNVGARYVPKWVNNNTRLERLCVHNKGFVSCLLHDSDAVLDVVVSVDIRASRRGGVTMIPEKLLDTGAVVVGTNSTSVEWTRCYF